MENENENIELRSEKVRNIIGQIPPRLMRIGISVIFILFIGILTGTYFFKYEYVIKTTATIMQKDGYFHVQLRIPANQVDKIKPGQMVILSFENIPNLNGHIIKIHLTSFSKTILVSEKGGFFTSIIILPDSIMTVSGNSFNINGSVIVQAEIVTEKISFFDRIFEPIEKIFKKNQ